jgi:excinuclease UvrABC nuclease subunit
MAVQKFALEFDGYWQKFNIDGIPAESGVYCVYECTHNTTTDTVTIHKLIYIGEGKNVNDRIDGHEKWPDWKKHVRQGNQLCFSFAYVEPYYRERVEAALIFEHKPIVNDEYKYSFPFDKTMISLIGDTTLLITYFTVERT